MLARVPAFCGQPPPPPPAAGPEAPRLFDQPRKVPDVLYTPASAYESIYADVLRLKTSGAEPGDYRYFSCYNAATQEEIDTYYVTTAIVGNSLNFFERPLQLPVRVNERLFRMNIYKLGQKRKNFDELGRKGSGGAPAPEPYFHQPVTIEDDYGRKVEKLAVPNWVDKKKAVELIALMETEFPVFRCDWFAVYAFQPPAYYRFMGDPKNIADFEKLAGVEPRARLVEDEAVQLFGAVLFSEVADHNRRLERSPSKRNYGRGYLYRSFDFFASIKDKNVVKNPLVEDADAGELIFANPNGLHGFGLINKQEKRVDFGDSRLVSDKRTTLSGKTLYAGWQCMACHAKGAIPVADTFRLTAKRGRRLLITEKAAVAKKKTVNRWRWVWRQSNYGNWYQVQEQYQEEVDTKVDFEALERRVQDVYFGEEINNLLAQDSTNYLAAVRACTGQDGAAVALKVQEIIRFYMDAPLTLEDMALDYGYQPATIKRLLETQSLVAQLDPVHVALLEDQKARRDHFEESFYQVMQLLPLVPVAEGGNK